MHMAENIVLVQLHTLMVLGPSGVCHHTNSVVACVFLDVTAQDLKPSNISINEGLVVKVTGHPQINLSLSPQLIT